MNVHLMLDFETLGLKADSAVLSLGAVVFNREQILRKQYWEFDLNEQLRVKRSINGETLGWWFNQGQEAQALIGRCSKGGIQAKKFADEFQGFMGVGKYRVWSNGASFDVPIMENLLAQCGRPIPWDFWNIRCYRTMKAMFHIEKGHTNQGLKHHAGDDAEYQAENVRRWLSANPLADA